jgi:two-component system, sensor histidine kinase and response regulator
MPDLDGLGVAHAIAADDRLRGMAIYMLSSGTVERAELEQAGIAAHLTKPIRESQLYDLLATTAAGNQPAPPAEEEPLPAPALPGISRGRVLLVEDNPVNQRVALLMLENQGWQADAVTNGAEAVAAVAHAPYDLVFMDCRMPEMDGYEATRRIRDAEVGGGQHTPIVAMTANATEGEAERCLTVGMDDYLAKPVRPAQLAATLERWAPQMTNGAGEAIDRTALDALAAVDPEVVREVIELFQETSAEQFRGIESALAQGDGSALRRAAHTLRGGALTVGACRVAEVCEQLERLRRSEDEPQARALVWRLHRELEQARVSLKG